MTEPPTPKRLNKDALAEAIFGTRTSDAIDAGRCVRCKRPPTFTTEAGRREYRITGLCEPCFDLITNP